MKVKINSKVILVTQPSGLYREVVSGSSAWSKFPIGLEASHPYNFVSGGSQLHAIPS